ncbi:3-hydroxyacyl-CoA dehydrogenase family protein [Streptomyces sioyaensis]|uniref:3-hydroxyacyl-CoA dehydrogenase family protein n=1 Tax=Streptomyces sioyaensis TaxID=67364 RepID=UPI001F3A0C6B|nr:3-hydroxyacyl-CoA dehydrogenase family protein [Streptomyces sioyaensis]MCF3171773.1 3-hydroxyacyl-CoA dehydrogenase family protein [Streptomyces sioyaensis]
MAQRFSTIAVIGLGTTGSVLANMVARSGRRVIAVDTDASALDLAGARLTDTGRGTVDLTTRPADITSADLVIEAVPERMTTKCEVLGHAHHACAPDTVFATTTTGLAVTDLAFGSGRPSRTVGLHLFPQGPMDRARAVEVVSTPLTDGSVRTDVHALIRDLGQVPVSVPDRAGFVGGALTMAYLNDAATMYAQRYASRDGIDTAMRLGCGLPRGPLAHLDAIGLDVARDTLDALYERTGDRRFLPAPVLTHMVAAGLLGLKTGRGFHDYGAPDDDGGADPGDELPTARPVRRIGVVGSGTMATGIAEVCARAGYPTTLVARSEVRAKEALATVEHSLNRAVQRGRLTPEQLTSSRESLTGVSGLEAVAGCDLVVEAVVEDIDVKRAVFRELDAACGAQTVLATSTSSLPVIECAMATGRPEAVVGMHFFNPAPAMKLVEVVRTALTSRETLGVAHATATALGKRPVDCPDRSGFIVNALLFPYLNSAVALLDEGILTAEDIDTVMALGQGYPMGPLQLLDVIGLDVSVAILRTLHTTFREPCLLPSRPLEQLVSAGHLGRKRGRGLRHHEG